MKSYTLDNLKRDSKQNNLYNLLESTVVDKKKIVKKITYVQSGEDMRLDKVSDRIYGTRDFVEELMVLNNINNSWEIKEGDQIIYITPNSINLMHVTEEDTEPDVMSTLNKKTRLDEKRSDSSRPPTIKPANLKQIDVNTENNKIKIINKFQ